jgi:hypothetical protein
MYQKCFLLKKRDIIQGKTGSFSGGGGGGRKWTSHPGFQLSKSRVCYGYDNMHTEKARNYKVFLCILSVEIETRKGIK